MKMRSVTIHVVMREDAGGGTPLNAYRNKAVAEAEIRRLKDTALEVGRTDIEYRVRSIPLLEQHFI